MAIYQPDHQSNRLPVDLPTKELINPHASHDTTGGYMPVVLWTLLLIFAVLMLLATGPREAPPFEILTAYTCDSLPVFYSNRVGRSTPGSVTYTCRAGTQVIYQRGWLTMQTSSAAWLACRRADGVVKIWRYPNPSPYGAYVFQTTCNEQVFLSYRDAAATYETTRASSVVVAWGLVLLSTSMLGHRIIRRLRRHAAR